MPQARVLTDHEQKRILAVVAQTKHAPRNRMAFILSYQAGMRVGEIASLTVGDVFEADSKTVRSQIRLSSEITKGGHARTVFVSDRLRREIEKYRATVGDSDFHVSDVIIPRSQPMLLSCHSPAALSNSK